VTRRPDALIEAADLDLVRVGGLALLAAVALAPRDLDAHALDVGLAPGHVRRGGGFLGLHLDDAGLGGGDGLRQHALPAGQQHLLPAAQLVAQPLVAPGLRGLPLQRAALFLDLEDDVVDAREVLPRRVELPAVPARLLQTPAPRSAGGDRWAAAGIMPILPCSMMA
jgi:hypothetical protein